MKILATSIFVHGGSAQPTPTNKRGVGLTQSHTSLFFGLGSAGLNPLCAKIDLARIFTCTTSQNVLVPCVENVSAVEGSAGPTPRGVIQRHVAGAFLKASCLSRQVTDPQETLARANLAIRLSSNAAANLAANSVAGLSQASRQLQRLPCSSLTGVF